MSQQPQRGTRTVLPPVLGVPFVLVIVALLAGAAFYLISGSSQDRSATAAVSDSVLTTGHVVSVRRASNTGDSYVATVRFEDRSGRHHEFTAPASKHLDKRGSAVSVSYDGRQPAVAHDLSADDGHWRAPLVTGIALAALACLAFIGAVVYIVWLVRKHPQSAFT